MSSNRTYENQINFEKLHLSSRWSDVNFLFGSNQNTVKHIPAHKLVLACESDVFAAMFYGELKEKGDIAVTDASIDAFQEFLQFFYLNCVELTVENIAEVMNLGHKYNVTKCVDICVQFLKDVVADENICTGLNLAVLYEQKNLKTFYENYIAIHAETIFKSTNFLNCDKTVLALMLKVGSWPCSETVVFDACMSWIKMKTQQDEVTKELVEMHLGDLFYEIRFAKMTMVEFANIVHSSGSIFSADEYKEIIETIMITGSKPKLFNGNPRQLHWNEAGVIFCERKSLDPHDLLRSYYFASKNEPTQLQSNHPILLGELVFAPLCNLSDGYEHDLESNLPVDVTIIETAQLNDANDGSTRVLLNFKIHLPSRMEKFLTMPAPILIRPGFFYEIRLEYSPEEHCVYICRGLVPHVYLENNTEIYFYGDRIGSAGLVNLITALGFNKI